MPVVRRHVRSKRRWHRDYLLAHLVPVVVRLSALAPPLGRQPRLSALRIASRIAGDHSDSGSSGCGNRLNGRPAFSASKAAIAPRDRERVGPRLPRGFRDSKL